MHEGDYSQYAETDSGCMPLDQPSSSWSWKVALDVRAVPNNILREHEGDHPGDQGGRRRGDGKGSWRAERGLLERLHAVSIHHKVTFEDLLQTICENPLERLPRKTTKGAPHSPRGYDTRKLSEQKSRCTWASRGQRSGLSLPGNGQRWACCVPLSAGRHERFG